MWKGIFIIKYKYRCAVSLHTRHNLVTNLNFILVRFSAVQIKRKVEYTNFTTVRVNLNKVFIVKIIVIG